MLPVNVRSPGLGSAGVALSRRPRCLCRRIRRRRIRRRRSLCRGRPCQHQDARRRRERRAAEAEAARICANLGLPDRVLAQTIGTLSGGQRRRIELARILFRDASETGGGTLLLDEPTNHLDADSITWLRGFLAGHKGGLIVISPRRRPARRRGQQGLVPRRQPVHHRRLQPRLEGLPGAARDRRAAPPPGAGQRREEGRRPDGPGRQDAGQGHQGGRRAEHGPPGREDARRPGGGAGLRQGGQGALPRPRPRAARPR